MDALVDRFYEPLYRFALSLAASEPAAADLTQETFYLWAAKGHQLRDPSKVKTWLFTTLYREFLRLRRQHLQFPGPSLDDAEHELPPSDPVVADTLDGTQVMAALQQVAEMFRVPLTLFYVEDFSYQDIATALELPVGTVMSRLSRGKAQLRRLLVDPTANGAAAAVATATATAMPPHVIPPPAPDKIVRFRNPAQG